ncbi:hypothetical protein BLNAU_10873 [Blattamonas nauphoetae]|uniref:R3H domain-containing protein n=1 Tax=Blattamonas nauphoetae TaxID=2049346 RepID=A0ABQ9XPA3_9EUKA|nr:hypothetical protein BLNAU_10873 [Blattamonas nauphoetae]
MTSIAQPPVANSSRVKGSADSQDLSDFSDTFDYSTTEAEMSDARKARYKQQQRVLFKMKNPNRAKQTRATQQHGLAINRRLGAIRQDPIEEDDDNLRGSLQYVPQPRYVSRSLFHSFFSSDSTNETEDDIQYRKRLWDLWIPLLETSFEAQEQYLKNLGVNKPVQRKGLWRRAKIPKEFKQLLKRQPDPMFIAQFENELLEYIQSYDTQLKAAFSNSAEGKPGLPPEIRPFLFHDEDPFHRLLAHSVAQYYGFTSESKRNDDGKVTLELNGIWRVLQHLPDLTLSEYLVKMEKDKDKMYLQRHFKEQSQHADRKEQKRKEELRKIKNRMKELTAVQMEPAPRPVVVAEKEEEEAVGAADNAFALLIDEEGNREGATARLTSLRSDFPSAGQQKNKRSQKKRQKRP